MVVPPAFKKLCRYFHQDIGLGSSSPEEWVDFAKRHLDENEKSIVTRFLNELLGGDHEGPELQRIWFAADADIYFPDDEHLRGFLDLIRARLH
jgi:hypothetical protein